MASHVIISQSLNITARGGRSYHHKATEELTAPMLHKRYYSAYDGSLANPTAETWSSRFSEGWVAVSIILGGAEQRIHDIESDKQISRIFIAFIQVSPNYGSGGWIFGPTRVLRTTAWGSRASTNLRVMSPAG